LPPKFPTTLGSRLGTAWKSGIAHGIASDPHGDLLVWQWGAASAELIRLPTVSSFSNHPALIAQQIAGAIHRYNRHRPARQGVDEPRMTAWLQFDPATQKIHLLSEPDIQQWVCLDLRHYCRCGGEMVGGTTMDTRDYVKTADTSTGKTYEGF